jgi:uncharacterized membrane protein (UPF0136 family)
MKPELIIWIYIVLLLIGGVMGFLKGKSKVSLIMSSVFAAAFALINLNMLVVAHLTDILLCVLLVVFAMRLAKTKKFMPAGLMIIVTGVTLGLLHAKF